MYSPYANSYINQHICLQNLNLIYDPCMTVGDIIHGIVAVLSQNEKEQERVIAYYNKILSKAERNYCVKFYDQIIFPF